MHTHILAILKTFVMPIARGIGISAGRVYDFLRHRPRTAIAVGLILVGALIASSILFKAPTPEVPQTTRGVSLVRVGDQSIAEPLTVIGEIRSIKEAFVSPDSSGTVANVYHSLGDSISAGAAIASLKNDRERAAVTQAEAALAKAKAGAAISGIGVGTASNTLSTAKVSASNALSSARSTLTDVVLRRTDDMFDNPTNDIRTFLITVPAYELIQQTLSKRSHAQSILNTYNGANIPTDTDALITALEKEQEDISVIHDYLNTLSQTIAKAIPAGTITETTIATYRSETNASIVSVSALETSLSSAEQNLKNAVAGVSIADQQNTDLGGENADVIVAKAALQNAQIALDHTIIRAPVSGTLNRLDLKIGDFVSVGSQVAYITNTSSLEIVAYIGSRDFKDIIRGAKVEVGGTNVKGVVTRVGTALDPATKKAEVRITLDPNSNLVSGQAVTISIERRVVVDANAPIYLPITSVKLTPEGAEVFTVSTENKLEAHEIVLGRLEGSRIQVLNGLDRNWYIVEDARGLSEGETILVNE